MNNRYVVLVCLLALLLLLLRDYALLSQESDIALVERHVDQFRRGLNPKNTARIKQKLVPLVVAAANMQGLDPLMLAVTVSAESSWQTDVYGQEEEIGICQVMPGQPMSRSYNMKTTEGQLSACAHILKHCHDKCGSMLGAFSCYMTKGGKCVPPTRRAKIGSERRLGYYLAAKGVKNAS